MVKVTIGSVTFTAPSLDDLTPEQSALMIACYTRGEKPTIEAVPLLVGDVAPTNAPSVVGQPFPASSVKEAWEKRDDDDRAHAAASSEDDEQPFGPVNDGFSPDKVDEAARARIDAQHAAIQAAGIDVARAAKEASQVADNGTRMATSGYQEMTKRKAEHDAKRALVDVAHDIESRVASEHREDHEMSAADFARALTVNGKIHVSGRALTEQSIRGLASRLDSPMLGYLLGVRERMTDDVRDESKRKAGLSREYRLACERARESGVPNAASDGESRAQRAHDDRLAADRAMIAEVIRHECKRAPDTRLLLRTRNGGVDDVYAILSPGYVEADATTILPEILSTLRGDTRATFAYDPTSTQWEIRASVWTPTPTADLAIGEAFEGYVSLRSRDNGTSRFRGDGGITLIRCYNATTYNAGGASVARIHRGKVARDIGEMVRAAAKSIDVLCDAWGVARTTVVTPTAEQARLEGDAFLSALWTDMLRRKPLEGVMRGRVADHAAALVATYHAERRDPARLVRADMAQAWTRYIQGQPSDVRRDAETAIGSWIVGAS